MPCKHPASYMSLQCATKPTAPDHEWPEEGVLTIERCERFCWFCYKTKGITKPWKYAWHLRRHVQDVHVGRTHPNLTCAEGWAKAKSGNKKPWRERGSPAPMGRRSSTTPPTPPKTPAPPGQRQREALKKKKHSPPPAPATPPETPATIDNPGQNLCLVPEPFCELGSPPELTLAGGSSEGFGDGALGLGPLAHDLEGGFGGFGGGLTEEEVAGFGEFAWGGGELFGEMGSMFPADFGGELFDL